ncbi:type VI secretion system protein TssL, short form [Pseudomonas huanghezhanensis]|uniref:type VI secretion system protein TssL, short form n=1 Tax=Pseudomonas huanghezhanensis TaxID=3002903 RepID=UPI002285D2F8|nr:type VI secretion system protein TssL, short form [Pseudomonas sp. BSw22131]
MSRPPSNKHIAVATDIDVLMQDTYLLVVELQYGATVSDSAQTYALCARQVEHVRHQLKSAGLSQRNIDYISHAQCALLDETVLGCAKEDGHARWAAEPLQARFFNRHQAGDFVYEEMREVLSEPAPDLRVLTVFQRVLMLGFKGRYPDANAPERLQLIAALNAQVEPLAVSAGVSTQIESGRGWNAQHWLHSPMTHVLAAILLLTTVWWALDRLLGGLVATLMRGVA